MELLSLKTLQYVELYLLLYLKKKTVNAVGGQLYVANSTVLSGSDGTSASFTTMSVENVSGFVQGEILSLKKRETKTYWIYNRVHVLSTVPSRNDRSSDTDFSNLFVIRGYSGSLGGQIVDHLVVHQRCSRL